MKPPHYALYEIVTLVWRIKNLENTVELACLYFFHSVHGFSPLLQQAGKVQGLFKCKTAGTGTEHWNNKNQHMIWKWESNSFVLFLFYFFWKDNRVFSLIGTAQYK